MMYRQMQAEEESQIPAREEKELAEAFRLFDFDGNGSLEREELRVNNQIIYCFYSQYLLSYTVERRHPFRL